MSNSARRTVRRKAKPSNQCLVENCKRERERREFCWPCYRTLLYRGGPQGVDELVRAHELHGIPVLVKRRYPRLNREQTKWADSHIRAGSLTLTAAAKKLKVGDNTLYRALQRYGFRARSRS